MAASAGSRSRREAGEAGEFRRRLCDPLLGRALRDSNSIASHLPSPEKLFQQAGRLTCLRRTWHPIFISNHALRRTESSEPGTILIGVIRKYPIVFT
jgi:hypothetical protein